MGYHRSMNHTLLYSRLVRLLARRPHAIIDERPIASTKQPHVSCCMRAYQASSTSVVRRAITARRQQAAPQAYKVPTHHNRALLASSVRGHLHSELHVASKHTTTIPSAWPCASHKQAVCDTRTDTKHVRAWPDSCIRAHGPSRTITQQCPGVVAWTWPGTARYILYNESQQCSVR